MSARGPRHARYDRRSNDRRYNDRQRKRRRSPPRPKSHRSRTKSPSVTRNRRSFDRHSPDQFSPNYVNYPHESPPYHHHLESDRSGDYRHQEEPSSFHEEQRFLSNFDDYFRPISPHRMQPDAEKSENNFDYNKSPTRQQFNEEAPTSSNISATSIPEFNPDTSNENVHEWISLFSEVAAKNNWSLEDKKFHFANKLGGSARRWFINSKMMDAKWAKIKMAFKKAFPSDAHFYEQLITMINRVKRDDESMSNYFYHKIALINECGFNGVKAVSCLIGGLNNVKLKGLAIKQGFQTPEEMYSFLCKSEQGCSICNVADHSTESCVQKNKKDRTMLNVQGEMYNVVLVNKYVVDAFVNGIKILGYVSMDSSYVTVREEDAWSLKINYEPVNKLVKYFGKNTIRTIGETNVTLRIDHGVVDLEIYIVSNSSQIIPLVIGRSFSYHSNIKYNIDDEGVHYYNEIQEKSSHHKRDVPSHKDWTPYTPRSSSYRKFIFSKKKKGLFSFPWHRRLDIAEGLLGEHSL